MSEDKSETPPQAEEDMFKKRLQDLKPKDYGVLGLLLVAVVIYVILKVSCDEAQDEHWREQSSNSSLQQASP